MQALPVLRPTDEEELRLSDILARIIQNVRENRKVSIPRNLKLTHTDYEFALLNSATLENPFCGKIGDFFYQFEGEEDLLHMIVTNAEGLPLTPEEGQQVASIALKPLPKALVWFKPGRLSQHFYFGHDDLVAAHASD